MYKKLKPTIVKDNYGYNDYYEHSDIMELGITDEDIAESEGIEECERVKKVQRFPVWATKPNLILDDTDEDDIDWDDGWNLDKRGPCDIVRGFSNIKIKSEYKLIGYRYISGGNGNGVVWAIPKDIRAPEVHECEILKEYFLSPPKPKEALKDYMEAISGDKSPISYLQAAIVNHELAEYGASWHEVSWGRDTILPFSKERMDYIEINEPKLYMWEMNEEEPEIIDPYFYFNEN